MACSSNCPHGDCETYGACLRRKGLQVADPAAHAHNQSINGQLDNYVDARRSGMQPKSVYKADVDFARAVTDLTGVPYRADV